MRVRRRRCQAQPARRVVLDKEEWCGCNNSAGCEGGEHLRDTEKLNVLDVCGAKITVTCLQLLVLSQFMALNNDKLYIDSVALAGPAKGLQSG